MLRFLKFSYVPSIFNIEKVKWAALRKIDRKRLVFANGCYKMLLEVIGRPLGIA
jgi:hypothetical protein